MVRSTTLDAGDPGSNPARANSGHVTARVMYLRSAIIIAANLRYQKALDWRNWTKGGCSCLLLSAQF